MDYSKMLNEAQQSVAYWAEIPRGDFSEELYRAMREQKINKSQLVSRSDITRDFLMRALNGTATLTIFSMAKIAKALGYQVRIRFEPID